MMKLAFREINMCFALGDLLPNMVIAVHGFDGPNKVTEFGCPDSDDRIMVETSCPLCSLFRCFALVEHAIAFAVDAQYRLEVSVFSFHCFVPFR